MTDTTTTSLHSEPEAEDLASREDLLLAYERLSRTVGNVILRINALEADLRES